MLETITIEPKQPAIGSVIWLHGLGADGNDFVPLVPELTLPEHIPLRFVFPHAPVRPITINNNYPMRGWFDIYSLSDLTREDEAGIQQSAATVVELIHHEINRGIESQRILLAGFSQGGAIALYAGLRFNKPLAGILALSTYLPMPVTLSTEANATNQAVSIFQAHGTYDDILPLQLGKMTNQLLTQMNYHCEWHEYPMGHAVCPDEIKDIGHWLQRVFAKDRTRANSI
jgi:phospholipase/carboxylesterase